MKAISLTQPWATLVAIGAKRIETRSWATQYRGPLAIHAAAGLGPVHGAQGLMELCRSEPFRSTLVKAGYLGTPALPKGGIVAVCKLRDCRIIGQEDGYPPEIISDDLMSFTPILGNERAFGDYSPGRYAWLLADIKPLPEPIPVKGKLGLWEWYPPEGFSF